MTLAKTTQAKMRAPTAFGLVVLGGAIYAAGFPPWSWSIAPWVALAPLLVVCSSLSPGRAALAGIGYALVGATGVAWFLPGMLARYFDLGPTASWIGGLAIVTGLHGLYVGGYAAWVAWLVRRRAASPILVAGGWLACEFARAHGGLGAPWALMAYSQLDRPRVIQLADVAGAYGIGMLMAAVNAGLAAVVVPALRGRRPRLAAATIVVGLLGAQAYGQWRLGQSFADGDPVRVAVVQGGAPVAGDVARAARLARQVVLTRDRADADAGLIVWPEHALDTYLDEPSPAREAVLGLAADRGADLILGGPHFEPSPAGVRYHNSAYLVRDGRVTARYDKRRLVPFAEDDRLAGLRGEGAAGYEPGTDAVLLPATALRAAALLCVESMFPDLVRDAVAQGAEVLVNLSNDTWFGDPAAARQQLEIAALRAVENRRYLVRAAATGFSAVIDPYGHMLARSDFEVHQVLNATVRASHVRTPYQRWGDAFAWIVIAGVAAASWRSQHDRRRLPCDRHD